MWRVFKEAIWDYLLGRLFTVLGTIETIWAIVVLAKPEYGSILLPSIDNRIWYGIALAFMFAGFIRMSKVASNYKRLIESEDNIRFVYNEKRYRACKEIEEWEGTDIELYRVGIRVIGSEPVESLIVVPATLTRIDDKSYQEIPMSQVKLHPMTERIETIFKGFTPAYYVDVFKHVAGCSRIWMEYDDHVEAPIHLQNGQYELTLIARAKPRTSHIGTMVITMTDGSINIEMKKLDILGG